MPSTSSSTPAPLFVQFVVLAELTAEFLCGTLARKNEKALTIFLKSTRVRTIFADENTTHHFTRIFSQLRHQGNPISINDMCISALAGQHDLVLFSRVLPFDSLSQIARC